MKRLVMSVMAVSLAVPGVVAGQGGTMAAVAPTPTPQAAGSADRVWTYSTVESKTTTGRPYSAEAVTERTQVLADGNRISVSSLTRVFRDGEGRTRREMFNNDGTLRSITISDPVARVSYTLDPAKKIAYRSGNVMTPAIAPTATARYYESPERNEVGIIRTPAPTPAPATATATASGGGGRGGAGGAVMMRTPAPDDPNTRKEDLAPQTIEGVAATGSRTTTVIPAGQIGNAQEIRVVSEQWFSDDLQVLVMTRHADPRSGENVYRLRNIVRAEPDPSLFAPPADYTIQDRGVRRPQ
jgi:hypothetical protein